jgi:hypothetical protein
MKMSKNHQKDIPFMPTKDDILAYAKELGIPIEQVTDEFIELVQSRLNREFRSWSDIVKDVLAQATKCPLGLSCFPSCHWWKDGRCIFPRQT